MQYIQRVLNKDQRCVIFHGCFQCYGERKINYRFIATTLGIITPYAF